MKGLTVTIDEFRHTGTEHLVIKESRGAILVVCWFDKSIDNDVIIDSWTRLGLYSVSNILFNRIFSGVII